MRPPPREPRSWRIAVPERHQDGQHHRPQLHRNPLQERGLVSGHYAACPAEQCAPGPRQIERLRASGDLPPLDHPARLQARDERGHIGPLDIEYAPGVALGDAGNGLDQHQHGHVRVPRSEWRQPLIQLGECHRRGASQDVARKIRSEEHTSELQSQSNLVCRLLLEKKKKQISNTESHIEKKRYTICIRCSNCLITQLTLQYYLTSSSCTLFKL